MPVQINESGSFKTVGTSSNIFIEYFGNPSHSPNNSVGNGVAILNLPKDTDIQYQLPFAPSRALIVCRFVLTRQIYIPIIGLTQGETIIAPPTSWAYFGDGNNGPSSVQLSGDKLIFGKASADTFLSAIVIAKE